jgi:hypothetical protein
METEMDLTLEELDALEANDWYTNPISKQTMCALIAAARAHLEEEKMIAEYDAENRAAEEAIYSVEELADAESQECFQRYVDTNEALIEAQAEIERLREALEKIAGKASGVSRKELAIAALKGGDGE